MRAFALPYALLVIVVLVLFFSGIAVRLFQSLHFATYDAEQVRAEQLARAAADLGLNLFRTRGPDWPTAGSPSPPFTNDKFGPQFSSARLGGQFEIQVLDHTELSPDPFPSNQGTFKVVLGKARVQRREAQSMLSIKLTNPFVNFLAVSTTYLPFNYSDGPIFVNSSPPGLPGDARIAHMSAKRLNATQSYFGTRNLAFAGEVKCMGQASVANRDQVGVGHSQPPLALDGEIAAGTVLQHLDLNLVNNTNPPGGSITIDRPSSFQNNLEYAVQVPTMQDLLSTYRAHLADPDVHSLPVHSSDYPRGVLLEFAHNRVVVSKADVRNVGLCFDRSIYLSSRSAGVGSESAPTVPPDSPNDRGNQSATAYYDQVLSAANGSYSSNPQAGLLAEMNWDDPGFANFPLPTALTGSFVETPTGTPFTLPSSPTGQGDAFMVKKIVRGAQTAQFPLSRTTWTILRLQAEDGTLSTADQPVRSIPPPVYVRGLVRGKIIVVYDAADDAISPVQPVPGEEEVNCSMFVLGEHEAPGESATALMSPGVPGGVQLEDDNVQLSPSAAGTFSEDYCMLLSRGNLSFSGRTGAYDSWLIDSAGHRYDYREVQRQLDETYATALGSNRYRLLDADAISPVIPFQAVGIGLTIGYHRLLADARPLCSRVGYTGANAYVNYDMRMDVYKNVFSAPYPDGTGDALPALPRFMRMYYDLDADTSALGGIHSPAGSVGEASFELKYDYRWRSADVNTLKSLMKLPVGPVVLDRD